MPTDDPALRAAAAGLENSPDLVVVAVGPDLEIQATSARGRALFAGRELVGLSLADAFPEPRMSPALDRMRACFDSGTRVTGYAWPVQMTEPDGASAEHFFDFAVEPWRTDGAVVGVVGRATDVTDRVRSLQRAETDAEQLARDVTEMMQTVLLPAELPVLAAVDVAARYQLSVDGATAGGDWMEAVVRPEGRIALVVGDVVGHGVEAASVMAQLRPVLREHLAADAPLSDAVQALDRFAGATPGAVSATLCLVEIDPDNDALSYVTAGHPPPLLARRDEQPLYLQPTGGGPLATGSVYESRSATVSLGTTVLLYTDGIVEGPDRSKTQSTIELADVVTRSLADDASPSPASRAVERVCAGALDLLTRVTDHAEDITVLAAQRIEPVPALVMSVPAEATAVGLVHGLLAAWLDRVAPQVVTAAAVEHVAGELVTNVVRHAYVGRPTGSVDVRVELSEEGLVEVCVADRGRWRESFAGRSTHGQGLALTRAFVDHLDVHRGPDGTTVCASLQLTRPVTTSHAAGGAAAGRSDEQRLQVLVDDDIVHVIGDVDLETADLLEAQLRRATHGGVRTIVVDLDAVTLLASPGVQVLQQLPSSALRLRAAPGTPAQRVLELVGLPYETGQD